MPFSKWPTTFVSVKLTQNRQVTLRYKQRDKYMSHESTNTKKVFCLWIYYASCRKNCQISLTRLTWSYRRIKKKRIPKCTAHPFEMYTRGYFCKHLKRGKKFRLKVAWLHKRNLIRCFNFLFFFFNSCLRRFQWERNFF